MVYLAVQEQRKGQEHRGGAGTWAESTKLHLCHQFTVDDLHFLKRGGRISATTAVVGSMLQIKPVLHVDNEGRLINIGKAPGPSGLPEGPGGQDGENRDRRGKKDGLYQPRGLPQGRGGGGGYGAGALLGPRISRINYVGPVIGAHSGPGTPGPVLPGDRAVSGKII